MQWRLTVISCLTFVSCWYIVWRYTIMWEVNMSQKWLTSYWHFAVLLNFYVRHCSISSIMILHAKFHDSRLVNVKCIENIVVCFFIFRGRVIVFCSKLQFHCTLASQVNQRCMCGLFSAFLQQMLINTEHVFHDVVMHYWRVCWLILCWLLVLTTNRMTLVLCLSSWCALYAMLYRSVSISNCLLCALCLCVCVCLCKPLCCLECLPAFPAIQNLSSCAMYVYWRLVALPTCCAKQNLCNSMMSVLPASLLLSAPWTGDSNRLLHCQCLEAVAGKCEQCHVVSIRSKLNTDVFLCVCILSRVLSHFCCVVHM